MELFELATFSSSGKHDFEAILSYKVKIDISRDILLSDMFSREIARFELSIFCSSVNHDFEVILSQ